MASEHALQVAVAHMLQLVLDPERTWWSAVDHGAGKLSKTAAGMMKARGVKRGLPDFIVMAYACAPSMIGIELKTEKGQLSDHQRAVGDAWRSMGFPVYVARSLEEVQEVLEHVRFPLLRRMNFLGGGHERRQRPAPARHPRSRGRRKPKGDLPVVLG